MVIWEAAYFVSSRPVRYFLRNAVSLFHYYVKALSFSSTCIIRVVFRLNPKLRGVFAPPEGGTAGEKARG